MRTNLAEFMSVLRDKCLNRKFLTTKRVRINSKRARDYMAGYLLAGCCESTDKNTSKESIASLKMYELKSCAVTANRIESMKRSFKTHRSAFDFDKGFCQISFFTTKDDDKVIEVEKKDE